MNTRTLLVGISLSSLRVAAPANAGWSEFFGWNHTGNGNPNSYTYCNPGMKYSPELLRCVSMFKSQETINRDYCTQQGLFYDYDTNRCRQRRARH